jgi:hypothetical protein
MNTPLNLKKGDIVKTGLHIGLHLIDVHGFWAVLIVKFCYPPVLLNEIELAVIFWVKITDMTA